MYAPLDLGREEEIGSTPEVKDDEDVLFEIADRHFLTVDRGIQVQSETMDQGAQAQAD